MGRKKDESTITITMPINEVFYAIRRLGNCSLRQLLIKSLYGCNELTATSVYWNLYDGVPVEDNSSRLDITILLTKLKDSDEFLKKIANISMLDNLYQKTLDRKYVAVKELVRRKVYDEEFATYTTSDNWLKMAILSCISGTQDSVLEKFKVSIQYHGSSFDSEIEYHDLARLIKNHVSRKNWLAKDFDFLLKENVDIYIDIVSSLEKTVAANALYDVVKSTKSCFTLEDKRAAYAILRKKFWKELTASQQKTASTVIADFVLQL